MRVKMIKRGWGRRRGWDEHKDDEESEDDKDAMRTKGRTKMIPIQHNLIENGCEDDKEED